MGIHATICALFVTSPTFVFRSVPSTTVHLLTEAVLFKRGVFADVRFDNARGGIVVCLRTFTSW